MKRRVVLSRVKGKEVAEVVLLNSAWVVIYCLQLRCQTSTLRKTKLTFLLLTNETKIII